MFVVIDKHESTLGNQTAAENQPTNALEGHPSNDPNWVFRPHGLIRSGPSKNEIS